MKTCSRPLAALLAVATVAAGGALSSAAAERHKPPQTHICALTNAADGQAPGAAKRLAITQSYGLTCARSSISSLRWSGSDARASAYRSAGIGLILNVNNQPAPPPGQPAQPSIPPQTDAEIKTYRRTLGEILDTYRPRVLTVENEETVAKFYGGDVHQYLVQLRAAIKTAHNRDVKVTNGGITSLPTMLMTWHHIWRNDGRAAADDFAQRTLGQSDGRPQWPKLLQDLLARPYTGISSAQARAQWDQSKALVKAYVKPRKTKRHRHPKDKTPLDFVNFHWYFKDPKATRQAIKWLEHKTRRDAITTELGQYDRAPGTVTGLLKAVEERHLKWVGWYDGDGDPAQALHNGDCTIRPNGEALRDFVVAHPPANAPLPCGA